MWRVTLLAVIFLSSVSGQVDQYLREVKNPTGPTRGLDTAAQQIVERYVVDDGLQQQPITLQSPQEISIPDSDPNNPFTSGDAGFGLRLSQAPEPGPQRVEVVKSAAPPPSVHQVVQQQYLQQQHVQLHQPAQVIQHQQAEIGLPQLTVGQQYVDVNGNPVFLGHQQVLQHHQPALQQVAQVAHPVAHALPVAPVAQVAQLAHPVAQVAQFAHPVAQVAQLAHPVAQVAQLAHPVAQVAQLTHPVAQVAQLAHPVAQALPVAHPLQVQHHVVSPAVQHYLQPAAVAVPVVPKKILDHSPEINLRKYQIPALKQIGNLAIPVTKNVLVAEPPRKDIVFPPSVPAPASIHSVHRTVYSPVKVVPQVLQQVHQVAPVIPSVHGVSSAVPVVNQVQFAPAVAPVEYQHHQVGQVHTLAQPVAEIHHVGHQLAAVHSVGHPVAEIHHQSVAALHSVAHPVAEVHSVGHAVAAVQPVAVAHQPHQLVQVQQHLTAAVPVPAPVLAHQSHAVVSAAPVTTLVEKHLVSAAAPVLKAPVVATAPVVAKVKTILPEVTIVQQPVLDTALFQRHIFNVQHGSEPIIYQDLCTSSPENRNLRACVFKKGIRSINVKDSKAFSALPLSASPPDAPNALPKNIQDAIRIEPTEEAAASDSMTTTDQPDTAESKDSTSRKPRRKKNKGSTSGQTTEKPFELV